MFPEGSSRRGGRRPLIQINGPVGEMFRAHDRHPYSPSHIHSLGFKPGRKTLIAQVFVGDDEHLESDVVFGVPRRRLSLARSGRAVHAELSIRHAIGRSDPLQTTNGRDQKKSCVLIPAKAGLLVIEQPRSSVALDFS